MCGHPRAGGPWSEAPVLTAAAEGPSPALAVSLVRFKKRISISGREILS